MSARFSIGAAIAAADERTTMLAKAEIIKDFILNEFVLCLMEEELVWMMDMMM